jgi:phage shock protein PspC (stress-responsive transcriptional regulator)
MGNPPRPAEDSDMTNQGSERTEAGQRNLRRRTSDRVLGGVAGGLGDYFNIDPLLARIAFVGLMIFGGAGLVLYVAAWLLIPADGRDESAIESVLRRIGLIPLRVGSAVLIAGLFILLLAIINGADISFPAWGQTPNAFWAVAIIAVGVVLLRRRSVAPGNPTMAAPGQEVVAARAMVAPPHPRSPLAWYISAAMLLAIGVLAVVSQVAERDVTPGQFFGAALVVLGIGLVVGAWWGRARILILLALLLAPLAITASFITTPLEGGIGDRSYAPVTVAEVRSEYRSLGGRLSLDLTGLQTGPRIIHISASVAVGQLMVRLPEGASVEIRSRVGAGHSYVLGSSQDVGTNLDNVFMRHGLDQPTFVLDLQAGIGEVYVYSQEAT